MKTLNMLVNKSIRILFIVISSSCSFFECELDSETSSMVNKANSEFADLIIVEPIDCEWNYINIYLKGEVDTILVKKAHEILYSSGNEGIKGWPTLLVYNGSGRYLFSHSYTGRIYRQEGD